MKARGFKLRSVVAWMALVLFAATLLMGIVWKQYTYVNLSRGLQTSEKDRGRLQNEVMLLETEVRGLSQPSRLEELAHDHFGLVDPGPPIVIQPEGQVLASTESNSNSENNSEKNSENNSGNKTDTMKTASWHGLFKW